MKTVLFLLTMLFTTHSYGGCERYYESYKDFMDASKTTGGPVTAIGMGAISFFCPPCALAAGAAIAATAMGLKKKADAELENYHSCLAKEQMDRVNETNKGNEKKLRDLEI